MSKRTTKNVGKVSSKKTVQQNEYSSDNRKSVWCFDMLDRNGSFAFNLDRDDFRHKDFMDKLIAYSNMTWSEIKRQTHDNNKSKHHFISPDKLSSHALERLKATELEEFSDSIFSFAFDNKLRVIGIRTNEYFHVLWYDPRHEVCPSTKKHT